MVSEVRCVVMVSKVLSWCARSDTPMSCVFMVTVVCSQFCLVLCLLFVVVLSWSGVVAAAYVAAVWVWSPKLDSRGMFPVNESCQCCLSNCQCQGLVFVSCRGCRCSSGRIGLESFAGLSRSKVRWWALVRRLSSGLPRLVGRVPG